MYDLDILLWDLTRLLFCGTGTCIFVALQQQQQNTFHVKKKLELKHILI
jgi:hypothetical protein